MFRGLLNSAKSAVNALILQYVARASVAVPFIIALGFAIAAGTVMLTESYGRQSAYWIMAGSLALLGLLATLFVSVKEHEEAVADTKAAREETENVASKAISQAPLALIGGLLSLPSGPATTWRVAKLLGKNYALVLFLVLIGAILWPKAEQEAHSLAHPGDALAEPMPPPATYDGAETRAGRGMGQSVSELMTILLGLSVMAALAFTLVSPNAKQAIAVAMGW